MHISDALVSGNLLRNVSWAGSIISGNYPAADRERLSLRRWFIHTTGPQVPHMPPDDLMKTLTLVLHIQGPRNNGLIVVPRDIVGGMIVSSIGSL